jgi:hypothetical protein
MNIERKESAWAKHQIDLVTDDLRIRSLMKHQKWVDGVDENGAKLI